jgi:hypothetical protein
MNNPYKECRDWLDRLPKDIPDISIDYWWNSTPERWEIVVSRYKQPTYRSSATFIYPQHIEDAFYMNRLKLVFLKKHLNAISKHSGEDYSKWIG